MTYNISVYRNTKDNTGDDTTFDAVHKRILSGEKGLKENTKTAAALAETDPDGYKVYKAEHFLAVTFAGTFSSRKREIPVEQRLKAHSGLLVLDFDGVDVATLMAEVSQRSDVFFAFVSPSGKGVKVVVKLDPIPTNATEHSHAWTHAAEAFSDVVKADPSGKDVTRLCFLAHDPRAFYNPDASAISWESIENPPVSNTTPPKRSKSSESEISAILNDIDGSDYENWLKVGTALYHMGYGCGLWVLWSKTQPKYKDGECEQKWNTFDRPEGAKKVGFTTLLELSGRNPQEYNGSKSNIDDVDDAEAPRNMLSPLPVDEHSTPEFPNYDGELFIGAFQNLYKAYADTHVWSPEMIMAFGIGSLSYVAGRSVTVQTHKDTKPQPLNSYILAVGESDLTAKSEAVGELTKHIMHCDGDFAAISNVQSLEGILKALGENDQACQYVMLDESSVVFTNSRREGTKNILGGLNELWLCPPNYTTVRAGEKARVDFPYLNCWGNIPTELIPSVFRQEDLIAGTLNRWLPFYITPKTKTERSPHPVSESYDMWIKRLKSIYSGYGSDRRLIFTTEADDARFEWYDTLRQNAIKGGTQTGESRFHTHAVKLAGLFALADNRIDDDLVSKEHWETALGVIRYLFQCYEYLFRNVGSTRLGDIENKILDMLNRNGNEMTLTELGRKVRGTDSTERERVIEALEKHGVVLRFREETNGRYTTKIRRVG